jgi:hypothetical protein
VEFVAIEKKTIKIQKNQKKERITTCFGLWRRVLMGSP